MKLSVAWIFDHLDADWTTVDIPGLVTRFNQTTAEIERTLTVSLDTKQLSCARVMSLASNDVQLESKEWSKTCSLPIRQGVAIGEHYLIKKVGASYQWASMLDLGSSKESLIPALTLPENQLAGGWKKEFECHDVIIEIDNKSITNRPDLWGHRGIAREIGAMLGLRLKPLQEFVVDVPVQDTELTGEFKLINKTPQACKRIAGLSIPKIKRTASALWMAHRLIRVDARPIDYIVDTTNYVMFDISQPMHAFDADTIAHKTVMTSLAKAGEKLTLLDGQVIELSHDDLVISDGSKALGLAGIMGGQSSAVSATTQALFLEAACFDASTIRKSAARHKKRTDASARFEKSLDPNQNIAALQRFVFLMHKEHSALPGMGAIASRGSLMPKGEIRIKHDFIADRLGMEIEQSFIIRTLMMLGFEISSMTDRQYTIIVPTFRATKDITIPEDIVEEIARFWGYSRIQPQLPSKQVEPSSLTRVRHIRIIKEVLATALSMRELYGYPFFDESFLRIINWQPTHAVSVQNPVSENWRRLVTTLIPNVCKAVHDNYVHHDLLRFFEAGRVWEYAGATIQERKAVAGIIFNKRKPVDFYEAKQEIEQLFHALALKPVWRKGDTSSMLWFLAHQTAVLEIDGKIIGYFGVANPLFFNAVAEGYACLFHFYIDSILENAPTITRYKPLSKYPAVERDISLLIPLNYAVDDVLRIIKKSHGAITDVALLDFFEKPEWHNHRSLTFRFTVQSHDKTFTKEEVDAVHAAVTQALQQTFDAVIR